MKSDLTNITFCIPYRKDSQARENNLCFLIEFLQANFDTNIFIIENGKEQTFNVLKGNDKLKYQFQQCNDEFFHRTKILNDIFRQCNTQFVANYDTDVIFRPLQYIKAYELLLTDKADIVYPYNAGFFDIDLSILKTYPIDNINFNEASYKTTLNTPYSVGGAVFCNLQKYKDAGLENEKFISYGYEDNERIARFNTLGYRVERIRGLLFHLKHSRGVNSWTTSPYFKQNESEYKRIMSMDKTQLLVEIKSWHL